MNTSTAPATSKLELARLLKAPASRVFAAWTDPEQVAKWISPGEWRTVSAEIDLRVGGEFRFRMARGEREIEMRGVYREVTPSKRLVFTWKEAGDPEMEFGDTLVTVEFNDRGDSTELRLRHEGFVDDEFRDGHVRGWNQCLDEVESLLATAPRV